MAMGFRPGLFGRPKMGGMMGIMPGDQPGLPQMGGTFDVPNTPMEQPKKQGLFGGELNINPKLAMLSQIFSNLGGSGESPVFSMALMQQQQKRAAEQAAAARQADWEDFQRQFDYKQAHEAPRVNDTVEDFNWYKALSPEDRAMYHKMRPVYRQGPDGQFYAVDTGGMAGGAVPTFTDDDWNSGTPVGGQPAGTVPFAANKLDHITMMSESGGNPNAISPKGAMGLMQVMPATARDPGFGISPWKGGQADLTRVGREYRAAMEKRYGGDLAKMWAAYNAGPGRVDKALKSLGDGWLSGMPAETKAYVRKNLNKVRGR